MATLIWTESAIADMENIYDYIANDSPVYAQLNAEAIIKSVERLKRFPESGRCLPEFPNLLHREVIVGNYRVVYRYDSNGSKVNIIAVVHGSRLLENVLFKK